MNARLPDYSRLLWPDRVRCCGKLLLPHTLGHALLMERLDSPLQGRWPPDYWCKLPFGDVLLAAWVCSRPWAKAWRQMDGLAQRFWFDWRSLLRWKKNEHDSRKLLKYLSEAWQLPDYSPMKQTSGSPRGTSELQILVQTQRQRYGLTISEALDVPIAAAISDHYAGLESDGVIRLHSEFDDELEAMFARIDAGTAPGQPGYRPDSAAEAQ